MKIDLQTQDVSLFSVQTNQIWGKNYMEFYSNDYNRGTISSTGIGWSDRAAVVGEESFGVTVEVMAQERRRLLRRNERVQKRAGVY